MEAEIRSYHKRRQPTKGH